MKKIIVFIAITIAVMSCSNPLDKKYNKESFESDITELKESNVLSEDDLKLLAGEVLRSAFANEDLNGKSYGQIIENAKIRKAEQDRLAEQARIEEENRIKMFDSTLTVAMYDKGYQKVSYEDFLTYSFIFSNKSSKDIRAFKGRVVINDLFETEIKSISLTVDDLIKAGASIRETYTSDYNQFRDEDVRLRNKDMEDLIVSWIPEKVIFNDGTTIE